MNSLRRKLESALYRLKRRFGVVITYKRYVREDLTISSGERTLIFEETVLTKVPMLEAKAYRDFEYDLSYIAANKNFTYGGVINRISRLAIIDTRDYPTLPTKQDKIVYLGVEYFVAEIYPNYENISFVLALTTSLST